MKHHLLNNRNKNIVTAHFNAQFGDISDTVIICSSSVRAKKLSEYLYDCALINTVRDAYGYTGYYKDKCISIMTTGMGMPSTEIYLAGLIYGFNCKNIIKCDTCLGINSSFNINDIFIAESSTTQDPAISLMNGQKEYYASKNLLDISRNIVPCEKTSKVHYGKGYASMFFGLESHHGIDYDYRMKSSFQIDNNKLLEEGVDMVEMENYLVYKMCSEANINSVSICRVAACTSSNQDNFLYGTLREKVIKIEALMSLEIAAQL